MYENNSVMKLRRYLAIVLVAGLATVCGCDEENKSGSNDQILSDFCSCTQGDGTYYTYAGGLIKAAGKTLNYDFENRETASSLENASLIASGDCTMGLVQEDTFKFLLDQSREGTDPQSTITASNLRVIMTAYSEPVHFLINTENITDADGDGSITPGDLNGKNVGVGPESSSTYITAKYILKSYDLDGSNCTLDTTLSADAVTKVVNGELDAMFIVSSVPYAPLASESLTAAPIQLVRCWLKSGTQYGMYSEKGIIDFTSYPFQTDSIDKNLQVKVLVAVSKDFDTSNLQGLYDYLSEHKEAFEETYDANWSAFSLANTETLLEENPLILDYTAAEIASGYDFSELINDFYTGPADSNYEKVADDITPYITPSLGYASETLNSTGSGENAISILRGDAFMAIVQDDVYDYLTSLDDSYEGMKAAKMKKLMPLYNEDVLFVVNRASEIDSVSDMAGKKVCLSEKTSGSFISGLRIINSYGFDMDNAPTYSFNSPADGLAKVITGEYDAVVLVDNRPSSLLTSLSDGDAALIKIIPAAVKDGTASYNYTTVTILQSENPLLARFMPDGDIASNAHVTALLVISAEADNDGVYDFIETIYLQNGNHNLVSASGWDSVTISGGMDYFRMNPYGWSRDAGNYYCDRLLEE